MKKKILHFAMLPLLAASLLVGCNEAPSSSETKEPSSQASSSESKPSSNSEETKSSEESSAPSSSEDKKDETSSSEEKNEASSSESSSSESSSSEEPGEVEQVGISHDFKGFVDNNALSKINLPTRGLKTTVSSDGIQALLDKKYTVFSYGSVSTPVAFMKNNEGFVGIYNKIFKKFINECEFYYEFVESTNYGEDYGMPLASIRYDGKIRVMDVFGNVFYDDAYLNSYGTALKSVRLKTINENNYVVVRVNNNENVINETYYLYKDGKATKVDVLPELKDDGLYKNPIYNYGDIFKYDTTTRLDMFGLKGYSATYSGGMFAVYNENDECVSYFPFSNLYNSAIVGNYIYYQEVTLLPADATEYDYFETFGHDYSAHIVDKYDLTTYKIDYLTGKKYIVNGFNYLVKGAAPYLDENGVYSLAILEGNKIALNRSLESTKSTIVVNGNNEILRDFTGYLSKDTRFYKFGESYYDESRSVLYDKDFNVISNLANCNPELVFGKNTIVLERNNKYGVIDSNGKVIIPFEYDSISTKHDSKFYVCKKENDVLFFTGSDANAAITLTGGNDSRLKGDYYTNLFIYNTVENTYIYNEDGIVYQGNRLYINSVTTYADVNPEVIPGYVYIDCYDFEKNEDGAAVETSRDMYIVLSDTTYELKTNGQERHGFVALGKGYNDAIRVIDGNNGVHIANENATSDKTHLLYVPTSDGAYEISFSDSQAINVVRLVVETKDSVGNITRRDVTYKLEGGVIKATLAMNQRYYLVVTSSLTYNNYCYHNLAIAKTSI